MTTEITIAARWKTLEALVFKTRGLSPNQLAEAKRIFYAGAFGMLNCIKVAAQYPEAEAEGLMNNLEAELVAFSRSIGTPEEI